MVDEDGQLRPALNRLQDAISALADPKPHRLDTGATAWLPPLYTQLRAALPGNRGAGSPTTGFTGCWVSALDLLAEVDGTVAAWAWCRGVVYTTETPTIARLHHLERRKFRPQDVHGIDQITQACEQWAVSITDLLGIGEVDICLNLYQSGATPAACPACNERWAYAHDSSGQLVRNPALQIRVGGCRCVRCHAVWGPEKFVWLSRILGDLPAGVLE